MSIIVKIPNDSSVGEWAIVELQGDLESRNNSSMHQQFIGDLHYTKKVQYLLSLLVEHERGADKSLVRPGRKQATATEDFDVHGKPVLIIGHHMLHGEVVTMDKPFAVLEHKQDCETSGSQNAVEYHVKAIVRRKLLFSDRPKPIIASASKTM